VRGDRAAGAGVHRIPRRRYPVARSEAPLRIPRSLRRTCLDCGFFAYRDREPDESDEEPPAVYEALAWVRRRIRVQADRFGQRIDRRDWFENEAPAFCSKHLWMPPEDAPINVLISEAGIVSRWRCKGFHPWTPGRTPQEHKALEDERRASRQQLRLAVLAFLGALLGALLPSIVGWVAGLWK
jgi:hypothetical protein